MRSLAIIARDNAAFRLTLDLSAWSAVGVSLGMATLRAQARPSGALASAPPTIEFLTNGPNPIAFDPLTGLATVSAPLAAVAGNDGVFAFDARAEFAASILPLFAGTLTIRLGVTQAAVASSGLAAADTAYVAGHPFGPAPIPAPLAAAVQAAQSAVAQAIVRSFVYGGGF